MTTAFDPSILQDFLTESGELLEQLEGDLVVLERAPEDPELLNKVFRALHTIKGSASFLSLTNLVEVAHAAESALNAARNRVIRVDAAAMTLLLHAVDLIKTHMAQIAQGQDLTHPPPDLVAALTDLGLGKQTTAAAPSPPSPQNAAPAASPQPAATPSDGSIDLPPERAELLEFLLADLRQTLATVEGQIARLPDANQRPAAAAELAQTAADLARSVDFFEFEPMTRLVRALENAGHAAVALDDDAIRQLAPRAAAIVLLLNRQADALESRRLLSPPVGTLLERVEALCAKQPLPRGATLNPGATAHDALATDAPVSDPPSTALPTSAASPVQPSASATPSAPAPEPPPPSASAGLEPGKPDTKPDTKPDAKPDAKGPKPQAAQADQTIRVEVGRLEVLMNLVGELVLQKNRLAALVRRAGHKAADPDLAENLGAASNSLERVTSDIQLAVMRTRMQPLDKIFGKYPRLIRDLSVKTGKKLELVIEGGDTEVDKSVIEELGDPLVHLLRNAADHGIELPDERLQAGKPEHGTITLRASHEGSHVLVQVIDDGRGLARAKIAKKAVERGLATQAEVDAMPDRDVYRFIFEAGFSTAEQVTDLSGRGVGMDVVRSNIAKIKGTIELDSTPGRGSCISIKIPLTIAIMPAMMVGLGPPEHEEIYAVPLGSIVEIVRPDPAEVSSVRQQPVMRLRDIVLPLVRGASVFNLPAAKDVPAPFAVVLSVDGKRFGLLVSRLIGQQEIVIKRLDEMCDKTQRRGPISGATVRDDGGVSLIVDVAQLMRLAEHHPAA